MNLYDSERMGESLAHSGYSTAETPQEADLVILNTCNIREKASDKLYSELGRLRLLADKSRLQGKRMRIAVAGCVAQAEGSEIMRRQPHVDLLVGPRSYHRLPKLLEQLEHNNKPIVDTDFPDEDKFVLGQRTRSQRQPAVFLAIQEGCDKFCSFCVVPYTRGPETSRSAEHIIREAEKLVVEGASEITLLGQNVNGWRGRGLDGGIWNLARLIEELATMQELKRIRYVTSHPLDMHDELIAAHGEVAKLMPYLHLPLQAGSNRILKAMNRRHSAEFYLELIERVRASRPDIAISGDFIVGFPGESEKEFEDTMRMAAQISYARAYSFKYSPRPGTPASQSADMIPEQEKSERLSRLQKLLSEQQTAFNNKHIGSSLSVLVEKEGDKPGQMTGRSPYWQAVHFNAPKQTKGSLLPVTIEKVVGANLHGSYTANEGCDGDGQEN